MPAPLPWFPLYVTDLRSDEAYQSFTFWQRGVYLELLCWQWTEGSIPRDVKQIQATLRIRGNGKAVHQILARRFIALGAGSARHRLVDPRLAQLYVDALGKSEEARRKAMLRHSHGSAGAELRLSRGSAKSEVDIRSQIQKSLALARAKHGSAPA